MQILVDRIRRHLRSSSCFIVPQNRGLCWSSHTYAMQIVPCIRFVEASKYKLLYMLMCVRIHVYVILSVSFSFHRLLKVLHMLIYTKEWDLYTEFNLK